MIAGRFAFQAAIWNQSVMKIAELQRLRFVRITL